MPEISIIDIASFNLPVFNERAIPAMITEYAQFEYERSKAWSAAIKLFDGYIFVAPECNLGVPGEECHRLLIQGVDWQAGLNLYVWNSWR